MQPFQRGFVVRRYLVENAHQYLTILTALSQLMEAAVNVARCRREYNRMTQLILVVGEEEVDHDVPFFIWSNLRIAQSVYLDQRRRFDVALSSMTPGDIWTLREHSYWDLYFALVHVPRWDDGLGSLFEDYHVARLIAAIGEEP